MLALSANLREGNKDVEDKTGGGDIPFCDAALEAFGLMSRELGRMMSYLVQARRQVWLSQAQIREIKENVLSQWSLELCSAHVPR